MMLPALCIAIIVFLTCEILGLNITYEILAVAAALSANVSLMHLNSTFQYVVDAFMLSAALAAGGVYLLVKYPSVKSVVPATILFTISMGLYCVHSCR